MTPGGGELVFDGRLPFKDNHGGQLLPTGRASKDYCEARFLVARCSDFYAAGPFAVDGPVHRYVEGQWHLVHVDYLLAAKVKFLRLVSDECLKCSHLLSMIFW